MIGREVGQSRAKTLQSLMVGMLAWLHRALTWSRHRTIEVIAWIRSAVVRPIHAVPTGSVKRIVLGRRNEVSVGIVLLAIVVVPAVAWWVATTAGYPPLEQWFVETWTGTDPHWMVFVGAAILVGIGILSAAVNSGFIPTSLLVMAPLFGVAVTRYGTRYTDPVLGSQVVSLPEAIEFATAVAVLGGLPLALAGFVLGELLRRSLQRLEIEALLVPVRSNS